MKMKPPLEWNWDIKGIIVLDIDKICSDCSNMKKEVCSKKYIPSEHFCLYFESAKKFPRITMENLENCGVFDYEETGIYFVSRSDEKCYTARQLNRETEWGNKIEKLLKELLLLKGKGSSSEARDIRKSLRKLGFRLRKQ